MINKYTLFISAHIFSCCTVLPANNQSDSFFNRCMEFLGISRPAEATHQVLSLSQEPDSLSLQFQLEIACKNNEYARAFGLIKAGANPNIPNKHGDNAAHIAAYFDAHKTLKMLTTKTAVNLNAYNSAKETPLSIAIRKNLPESASTVELLLSNNADPNKPATTVLWTPLMMASRLNNTPIMRLLLQHSAHQHETVNNQNALSIAYRFLCSDAADLLLEQQGLTTQYHPLQYIFGPNGSFDHNDTRDIMPILHVLNKHQIDLTSPFPLDNKNQPALYHALENPGNIRAVKALLNFGLKVQNEAIFILFASCMEDQNPDAVEKLTACLAHSRTIYKKNGHSLLIEAAKESKLLVAKAIIEACSHYCKGTQECLDADGKHPLHYLVSIPEDNALVHACIDLLTPFVNFKDSDGETPLMVAEHPAVAAHLIARGADVYTQDVHKNTALTNHIIFSNSAMVKFLLTQDNSADTNKTREFLYKLALKIKEHRRSIHAPSSLIDIMQAIHNVSEADQVAVAIRKPMSDTKRNLGMAMVRRYLDLNPNRFAERETNPRGHRHFRRS